MIEEIAAIATAKKLCVLRPVLHWFRVTDDFATGALWDILSKSPECSLCFSVGMEEPRKSANSDMDGPGVTISQSTTLRASGLLP